MDEELQKAYWVLGIEPGATEQEAKAAFRKKAMFFHPDRHPNQPKLRSDAIEEMKKLNSAYDAIKEDLRERLGNTENSLAQQAREDQEERDAQQVREVQEERDAQQAREDQEERDAQQAHHLKRSKPTNPNLEHKRNPAWHGTFLALTIAAIITLLSIYMSIFQFWFS